MPVCRVTKMNHAHLFSDIHNAADSVAGSRISIPFSRMQNETHRSIKRTLTSCLPIAINHYMLLSVNRVDKIERHVISYISSVSMNEVRIFSRKRRMMHTYVDEVMFYASENSKKGVEI